jgi:hypothetical protein
MHNIDPTQHFSATLARIEETMNDLVKNQTLMTNKITNLERAQSQTQDPPFKRKTQKYNQSWKSRSLNERRFMNTLDYSNVVSQEEAP